MFEFRVAELKVNDEFTINHGETWYRVTGFLPAARKDDRRFEAVLCNPPAGYEDVKYTLIRKLKEKVIVR